MRNVLWSIVVGLVDEFNITPDRVVQSASADEHYQTPFVEIKVRGTFPSVSRHSGGGTVGAEIWVHDSYGNYDQINKVINKLKRLLHSQAPVYGSGGSYIADITWESVSPDLNDDGYGTICRMMSLNLVGRDAD